MIDEKRDNFGGRPFSPAVTWMPTEESAPGAWTSMAWCAWTTG